MLIFIVPAWHPTKKRPTWSNWIIPHIEMTKELGKVVILQVDQDAELNENKELLKNGDHYYLASPIKKNRFTRTKYGFKSALKSYTKDLGFMYEEAEKVYGKPDLIHAHVSMPAGYGAAIIGKKHDVPVIVTEHYSGFFSDFRFPWRIGQYYKEMRTSIAGFYAVSPGFKKNIEQKTGIKVDGFIPNPINVDLFSPCGAPPLDNTLRLVSTGNVSLLKGTDILLKAVNRLPDDLDWTLTIIGNAPLVKEHWELLTHPKVTLLPRTTQSELVKYYSTSNVFIVSSRLETANVSMLEAMACGCFVITSKIGAPESLLKDSVAKFFTSECIEGLTEKITKVSAFNRNNQRDFVVSQYSTQAVKSRMADIYNQLLGLNTAK